MSKDNPVKDPGFQRTLRNLLTAPPKRHDEMKVGKHKARKAKSPRKTGKQV